MERIQIIAIAASLVLTFYVVRLIVKGKLREEYSFIWICSTILLIIFSFWRGGLDFVSNLIGIYLPANFVFTVSIFVIFIYLLHLSVVVSSLHKKNKKMAQEIALMKNKIENVL